MNKTKKLFEKISELNPSDEQFPKMAEIVLRRSFEDGIRAFDYFEYAAVMGLSAVKDSFSDEATTLWSNGELSLEIYKWRHRDTGIHDHHFAGAFMLLEGSQFNLTFEFFPKSIFRTGEWGELHLQSSKTMIPGDSLQITEGQHFIHQTLHFPPEAVTICLRTIGTKSPLSSYFLGGLRLPVTKEEEECRNYLDRGLASASLRASQDFQRLELVRKSHDSFLRKLAAIKRSPSPSQGED